MRVLMRWEFPGGGCLQVIGDISTFSVDDISDAVEALILLKKQCARIMERKSRELSHAADIPMEKSR